MRRKMSFRQRMANALLEAVAEDLILCLPQLLSQEHREATVKSRDFIRRALQAEMITREELVEAVETALRTAGFEIAEAIWRDEAVQGGDKRLLLHYSISCGVVDVRVLEKSNAKAIWSPPVALAPPYTHERLAQAVVNWLIKDNPQAGDLLEYPLR